MWLSLLQSLDVLHAPDLPPGIALRSLSTSDLRSRVVRAERSFATWNSGRALSASRSLEISIDPYVDSETYERLDPRLLPGGQRLVVNNNGRLEIWSLEPRQRLWAATSPHEDLGRDAISYDCEVAENGAAIMIAAVFVQRFASSQ